jgi:hypothetical protein
MRIAIIGSGIAGLYLGYKLKSLGIDFDIYEKNSIIGGRVKVLNFEGFDVNAGAGILTILRDKTMIHFCNELKIKLAEYTQKVGYTFEPIDVVKITRLLKRELKKDQNVRHNLTFSQFGKMVLGEDLYEKFTLTMGLTDYENADIMDSLYTYGFDEYVSGVKNYSIKWKTLLSKLHNILKKHIHLSSNVKTIRKLENNKFLVKRNIYDKVVFATNIDGVRQFLKEKIYRDIGGQVFARLYVKLDRPIENIEGYLVTEKPFQKILTIDEKKCIYMISYADNEVAKKWKKVNIKATVRSGLKKIFGEDFQVLKHKLVYWNIGTHYFKPLPTEFKNRAEFLKTAQNPSENIYVVGEAVSTRQGNCEGAIQSVNKILAGLRPARHK